MNEKFASVTRRDAMKTIGVAVGGLAAVAAGSARSYAAGEEITIMTWETYHDDPWLQEYTEKTGVKVNVIRFGSNDEVVRKASVRCRRCRYDDRRHRIPATILQSGSDCATRSGESSPARRTSRAGLNFPASVTVDGAVMAVPYNWGTQPLMYNSKTVTPAPDTWKALWDKKYEGRVSIPDDAYTVFPMVAIAAGAKDPFNLTDAEFEKCAQAFRDLRTQIKTLARGFDDQTAIFASGDADIGFCENISSVFALQKQGKPAAYSYPPGTLAWIDCACLTPTGVKRQVIYDFVNEMLSPTWQARFIQASGNNGILSLDAAVKAGVTDEFDEEAEYS